VRGTGNRVEVLLPGRTRTDLALDVGEARSRRWTRPLQWTAWEGGETPALLESDDSSFTTREDRQALSRSSEAYLSAPIVARAPVSKPPDFVRYTISS
jgi:hypothetical protein